MPNRSHMRCSVATAAFWPSFLLLLKPPHKCIIERRRQEQQRAIFVSSWDMGSDLTFRPAEPQEIEPLCNMMADMDPWKRLQITADELASAIRSDTHRQCLVAADVQQLAGTVMFRVRDANSIMFTRDIGPALA